MSLLEYPIRRYQVTLVAFLCLIALGTFVFTAMPREEDPYLKFSGYYVSVVVPGADPVDIERLVVKPIEDRLAELDDVLRMEASVVDGLAVLTIEFEAYTDPDSKFDEVTREIDALRPSLPAEIQRLEIRKVSPALVNIVQFALVSPTAPYRDLENLAREFKDSLKTAPGVRTAEFWAVPQRELRVEVDLRRMAEFDITPGRLLDALQSENSDIPAGVLDLGPRSFTLKTSGGYENEEQVLETVVASRGGEITRVRDIARVYWAEQPWRYVGRYNGQRAVFVTANQKNGYNIVEVRKGIAERAEVFANQLPGNVKLEWGFDQSRNVAKRLGRLYTDFGIAIALVLITLLPLGLHAAGIVMISVPLSLAFGLSCLFFLDFSLNQLSIAGFVLALGLLVDDSIVVVENISRHLRMGYSRFEAALRGTQQIFAAIIGCTAALLFAFLPLMALPQSAGKFIRVLPVTVVTTIVGSLLVALFIIPFLASRALPVGHGAEGNRVLQRLMAGIERWYRPALFYCLERPRATAWVIIGGSIVGSWLLVSVVGSSLFPKADTPVFLVTVETPNGSSFAETDRAARLVESELKQMPEVRSYFTNLGRSNPQVFYNVFPTSDAPNFAQLFVQLHSYDTRATPRALEALRQRLATYPRARITVEEFMNGPPVSAPIAVRIVGPDLDVLDRLSREIEQLMRGVPGTRDVDNPLRVLRTNLRLAPDSRKASQLGVPTVEFDRAVRLAISGIKVGTFKETDGEQYDITVRTPVGTRPDLATLAEIRVPTLNGGSLPLAQLATPEFETALTQIQRYGRERAITLESHVEVGRNTAAVTADVVRELDRFDWPRGYRYVLGGEAEAGDKSFAGVGTAAIVALFGIFAVLVIEFGSYRSTLIVLTVVPVGLLGGFLMLLVTGNDVSFTAGVGFIALIGIEIKNSILLVDFTNQLRQEGRSLDEAIERAGEIRFVPILLTTATAIGGLLPLALQNSGLYSPMAWVIIGGLLTSTFLARLVTPVMYKLFPPPIERPPVAGGEVL